MDDQMPDLSFRDQVWLWMEGLSVDRSHLRARARQAANPAVDPWGYLVELGQLIAAEEL